MLIQGDRMTDADCKAWQDYEEIDSAMWYNQKKAERSMVEIERFLTAEEKTCVMTSWGKDSIVMMDLFCKVGVKRPVVYMRLTDRSNPDCDSVRDLFLSAHPALDYREETFKYEEVSKGDLHWKILHEKYGKRVTGIRNDESKVRALQWVINGFASINSCRPLSLWKSSEIFSYIHKNNLPLCSVYGYLGGGRYKREQIRTHSIGGVSGNGMGRTEWEREYYPDILNRIERKRHDTENSD